MIEHKEFGLWMLKQAYLVVIRKGWIALLIVATTICWSYSEEESTPAGKKAVIITPPRSLFDLMDSVGQATDSVYWALPDSVRERLAHSAVEHTPWGQLKAT